MRSLWRFLFLILLVAVFSLLLPTHSHAQATSPATPQASDDDNEDDADNNTAPSFLSIAVTVDAAGISTVMATYYVADNANLPPAEIKDALQSALSCTLENSSRVRPTRGFYSGTCRMPFSAHGLLREGRISATPLTQFALLHHISSSAINLSLPDCDVLESMPAINRPAIPNSQRFPLFNRRLRTLFPFSAFPDKPFPDEIVFRFGFSASSVQRTAASLLLVLFLPIAFFVWLSRKALSADVTDKAVVWFSYMRSLSWILNGTILAWWIALEYTHTEQILQQLAFSTPFAALAAHPVFFEAFAWIPPTLVWLLCYRLSHPVQQRLRGVHWTKRELTLQAVYITLVQLFPVAMFLTGLRFLNTGGFRVVLLWWVGAFLLRIVAAQGLLRHTGMLPQALSSGDLRDRAFNMAERLGVRLQQVYLIPSGKGQLANAFARKGNTIAFTDFLLQRLSQREVDYVLAHELSHLRLKHPAKLAYAYLAGIFLGIFISGYVSVFFHDSVAIRYLLVFVIISLFPYMFSRRFEYSADAGAVAVTNDPRAAISALFKISELNMMPIHWSHWREKWLTHPSSMRRARAIARKANIPFEEIPVIAREGAAAETQTYNIPATAFAATKIHSTQHTRSVNLKLGLLLIALIASVPSVLSLAAVHVSAPMKWLVFASAIPCTFVGYLLLINYTPRLARRDMLSSLGNKLAVEGIQVKPWNGVFVSFAPAAAPRFYDTTVNWDIGYLFFHSDRISYCGEEIKFALRPSQITAIKLDDGMPNLISSKRIYIAWKDDERGTCGVFNLACGNCKSILQANQETAQLIPRLQAWWNTPPVTRPLPPQIAALTSPQFRDVTSQTPSARWKPRRIFNELLATAMFAAIGAILCGLPFHLMNFLTVRSYSANYARLGLRNLFPTPGAGWYVVAVALFVRIIMLIPQLRYRDVPKLIAESPASQSAASTSRTNISTNDKVSA